MLALRDVPTLDKGPVPPYVLNMQEMFLAAGEDFISAAEVLCIPVLARQQGLLLALPSRALPQEVLDRQEPIAPQAVLGPAKEVSVQAAIDDDGGLEMALDFEISVMLVDFDAAVLAHMHGYDPVTEGESIQFFLEGDVDVYPGSQALLNSALAWLEQAQDDRVAFYSAEESTSNIPRAPPSSKARVKATSGPKRVTTALLSQQLASLAETIPAISSSLAKIQQRQDQFEATVLSQASARPPAPHQMDFGAHQPGAKTSAPSPQKFMAAVGVPPRAQPAQRQSALRKMPEDEPDALPEEEEELIPESPAQVSQMLVQPAEGPQLPRRPSSHSGRSSRPRRIKLKLYEHLFKGICQEGTTSVGPCLEERRVLSQDCPECLPSSEAFGPCSNNAPRVPEEGHLHQALGTSGGVHWVSKGLGAGHVAPLTCSRPDVGRGSSRGSGDVGPCDGFHRAVSHGWGKWEVAWILSLQEDPPCQIFSHRPQHTNPRLRAFGPLCPADWGATALAYVKELDVLNTRRSEALPKKGVPGTSKQEEENPDGPKKPRQPRYPRKPKQQQPSTQSEGT